MGGGGREGHNRMEVVNPTPMGDGARSATAVLDASSVHQLGIHFPSMLSLESPNFVCGGRRTANGTNDDDAKLGFFLGNDAADAEA